MTPNTPRNQLSAVDIDALLQDSYLLVVSLREGAMARSGRDLWRHCCEQIEVLRQALKDAGMSQRNIDCISYAQCALLDETVLGYARDEAHADWAGEPLQAKFFNRHQAGEFLYEDMRDVLRDPAPNPQVLTAYHRVLMLGFKGRYSDLQDPEREELLRTLDAQVAPLAMCGLLISGTRRRRSVVLQRWLRSPAMQLLVAALLIVGTWWGLDQLLSRLVSSLLPGAA